MKLNYHKKMMYDFKYGITSNLHKEVEQIRKIQKVEEEKSSKQKNKLFKKTFNSKKPDHAKNYIGRNSSSLNVFLSCI